MAAFRFVHCADVHLDTAFRSRRPHLRERLREAGRLAFRRMVDLCLEERAHALLVVGDLFDEDRLSVTTEAFLVRELGRLSSAGIATIVTTGNHDPGGAGFRAHDIAWPDGVTLVRTRDPRTVVIDDATGATVGRVVACGHERACETENLARRFPAPESDVPAVAALHTQVTGAREAERHRPYAPCALEDLRARSYRYWALGHVHRRQCVASAPVAWYPGNLQGRHPGETGAKGALLVDIPDASHAPPSVTFRELAPLRWEDVDVADLSSAAHLDDVVSAVRAAFEAVQEEASSGTEWLLRAKLRGPCPMASRLRSESGREELGGVLRDELDVLHVDVVTDRLGRPGDLRSATADPFVESVLDVLSRACRGEDVLDSVTPEVLAAGPFDDDAARREYLLDVLGGAESLLADELRDGRDA